jgi:hypothetical protein
MLSGETMLQVPVPDGSAEVMSAAIFKRELGRPGPFQECVQRYSQGLLMLMMQSTGCMALHPVQERCCSRSHPNSMVVNQSLMLTLGLRFAFHRDNTREGD